MHFFENYIKGRGLNFSEMYIEKAKKISSFSIGFIEKYNYIVVDQENFVHVESDLINFSRVLKLNGYICVRKQLLHEEDYNQIFSCVPFLAEYNLQLINYECFEGYSYFVFKKKKNLDSIYVGAISNDKENNIKALQSLEKNSIYKSHFISVTVYSEQEYWKDPSYYDRLPDFCTTSIFIKHKEHGFSVNDQIYNWQRLINVCKHKKILLINDNFNAENLNLSKKYTNEYLYIDNVKKARKLNGLDFKYKTVEWAIYDFSVRMNEPIEMPAYHEEDKARFEQKSKLGLLDGTVKWINVHEALGDNICSFNLLNKLNKKERIMVSTAYNFLYELSPELKLNYNISEIAGLGFFVYEHGSCLKSKTLEYAYFSMMGEEELFEEKGKKYFYNPDAVERLKKEYNNKKIILLAPSASNREGPKNGIQKSNKSWDFENWKKLVEYLKQKGYYIIQVGAKEDFTVDNVDEFFFNRSFSDLVALVTISKFFLGLDTFFQHLCGLMDKKGIVLTPAHNDHAFWPSIQYIIGTNGVEFESMKWLKDHLNPHRKPCMDSISYEKVQGEVDKLISCFDKY